jgi:hypothetical protein
MEDDKKNSQNKGHLFTIEVLIEAPTNGLAIEKLLHLLNTEVIKDYKVKNGMELGKLIDLNIRESLKQALPQRKDAESKKEAEPEQKSKKQKDPGPVQEIIKQLESFKENNILVRMTVFKGKGATMNIPCRILNYDTDSQNVSVYHVDEKRVYLFKLNEIDEFSAV